MRPSRASIVAVLVLALVGVGACRSSGGAPSGGASAVSGGAAQTTAPTSRPTATRPTTTAHTLLPARPAPTAAARSGSCFTSSITVARAGAYRCFVGNAILDPCYASDAGSRLADCYADPWSAPVTVRLAKALPAAAPTPVHRPWAIVLTGRIRCLAATGVVPVVHGTPLTYTCLDGGAAALTGPSSAPLRTALYRPSASAALSPTTVTDVWAG